MKPAAVAFAAALVLAAGPASAAANPYVALGDSVAAGSGTYVGMLYPDYQALGATELRNRAQGGATTSSVLNGGQLTTAIADINASSDTKAVTIDIGGNDFLGGSCVGDCYRSNLATILSRLNEALAADPGEEPFTIMAYYNPDVGEAMEAQRDVGILGQNLALGCNDAGTDLGLNDVIYQEAGRAGIAMADPYPAFKSGGQSLMSDAIHPNAAGHAAIAQSFREAIASPCAGQPVDEEPPQTTITRAPDNRIEGRSATYRFVSSEPGSTFECRLDSRAFKPCSAPHRLKRLDQGRHRFRVRASDAAGNMDPTPAVDRFRLVRATRP